MIAVTSLLACAPAEKFTEPAVEAPAVEPTVEAAEPYTVHGRIVGDVPGARAGIWSCEGAVLVAEDLTYSFQTSQDGCLVNVRLRWDGRLGVSPDIVVTRALATHEIDLPAPTEGDFSVLTPSDVEQLEEMADLFAKRPQWIGKAEALRQDARRARERWAQER